MSGTIPLAALHAGLVGIAGEAGRIALADYRAGRETTAAIEWKEGHSPVTAADLAVDRYLGEALPALAPFPVHSEERPESWTGADGWSYVVDPIDGTRDFAAGGDAWCIVIGVIRDGVPLAGVVHVPARGITYSAFSGGGAFRNLMPLARPEPGTGPLRATGPRATCEHLAHRTGHDLVPAGSVPALAHRVLVPLEGGADLALARAGGHDWDIIASDCILREAGCALLTLAGVPPRYTLTGGAHPPLVAGPVSLLEKLELATRAAVSGLTNPA